MNNPLTLSQWVKPIIKIWCWIVGHNIICLKRHEAKFPDDYVPRYTETVHECLRCNKQWHNQWDQ